MIFFSENQLPKFQQIGMAPPYQISGRYGGRHTCHTGAAVERVSGVGVVICGFVSFVLCVK